MHTLSTEIVHARHQELLDRSERRRWSRLRDGAGAGRAPRAAVWQGLTLRLATNADAPAVARLAELDDAGTPPAPVLLGVLMARPVAALSLTDGRVVADPFTPTTEVIELLRLRARQLSAR